MAVDEFYRKDYNLIHQKAHERTCVAQIAHYLQNLLSKDPVKWSGVVVNCDYNRQGTEGKRKLAPPRSKRKYQEPDLLIHTHGVPDNNFLFAEFKWWWSRESYKKDFQKLKTATKDEKDKNPDRDRCKHYRLGVFVELGEKDPAYIYFRGGKLESEYLAEIVRRAERG